MTKYHSTNNLADNYFITEQKGTEGSKAITHINESEMDC